MKVTLICNSDLNGGAAMVTTRLMKALRRDGVQARMLVCNKLSDDFDIETVSTRSARSAAFMRERLGIILSNGFSFGDLFKVSSADAGLDLSKHPWVREADVIVLSWINQGMLSLKGVHRIAALGKPIVWIMHDMWNLTGICHHAGECERFTDECGCCPLLHSRSPLDLSHRVWKRKLKLYDEVPITFIAVSNWLAEKCKQSSLLKNRDVRVIPNAFPVDVFHTEPGVELRISALDYSKKIILMGAARLDHPIKGLDYAIDALNELFDSHPEIARDTQAVFFGSVQDSSVFDRLNFPALHLGTVNDLKVLHELYAASSVVLSTSLYETLPGTLIEGQAAGALPVTFGRGGQADIVEHLKNGYIAEYKNVSSVVDGLLWALSQKVDRKDLHEQVRERFSSKTIAKRYVSLFKELIEKNDTRRNAH